jgi:spore germination protein YaaH
MKYKLLCLLTLLTTSIFFISCTATHKKTTASQHIGAWLVFWDGKRGLSELDANGHLFHRVSFFAYELNVEGYPQPAPHFTELLPDFFNCAQRYGFQPWVTVVNDVRLDDGSALAKDVVVLRKILEDPERRKAHATILAEKVLSDGFAGLDLDYEGLCTYDQEHFQAFIIELSRELKQRNLGFNVILEPQQGPLPPHDTVTSTVMGYYLHGEHSGPGPIATPDFITNLDKRVIGHSKEPPSLALSLGGFSWSPGNKAEQVQWVDAQIRAAHALKTGRHSSTRSPYAILADGTEIWYEDSESIYTKLNAAQKAHFSGLMLWRLGGNDERLFELLHNYRNTTTMR